MQSFEKNPKPSNAIIPDSYEDLIPVKLLRTKLEALNCSYRLFSKGENVLDLGCGRGFTAQYIYEYGCNVDGIDINKESIEFAKKNYTAINFEIADSVDFKTNKKYNLVFSQMVICNIESEDRIIKIFKNVYNLLKNGGRLFLSNADINLNFNEGDLIKHSFALPLKDGDKISVQLLQKDGRYSAGWTNYVWTERKIIDLLKIAGFKELIIDNSIRENGYYFIISTK